MQHSVACGVFDLAQVDVCAAKSFLQEHEHVAQMRAHVPRGYDIVDPEFLLVGVHPHPNFRRFPLVANYDHLRYVLLNVIQRGQQHLLGLDPARIDISLANILQDVVDDSKLR